MNKYWSIFKTQVANSLAYPGDLAARSFSIVFFMLVFYYLWRATYLNAGGFEGTIAGLSLNQTMWYLLMAEAILLSRPRLSSSIAAAVKDGSIAYVLNKPYHFLLYHTSVGLGDSLPRLTGNLFLGGGLVWLLVGLPPVSTSSPLVILSIIFAWLINFSISSIIGLAAFVTEDVSAYEWIYEKLVFILGGLLIPLDFLPGWLQAIARAMPFSYTLYGPARFFVEPVVKQFIMLSLGQLAWLAIFSALAAFLFEKGIAWLTINGG
jgi:ABC-2 type transport system permease protein